MYKPIGDYGIIGDMSSVALISRCGSIDYCSMPHLDSDTVFAALLDDEKGGCFSLAPKTAYRNTQSYVEGTNVLRSEFTTDEGVVVLYDFMPIDVSSLVENANHTIHRCLHCESGSVVLELTCLVRPSYARKKPTLTQVGDDFIFQTDTHLFVLRLTGSYRVTGMVAGNIKIDITLTQGEEFHCDFTYTKSLEPKVIGCQREETQNYWRQWLGACVAGTCPFLGEFSPLINRSLLVLRLLTFRPTGAIAAAATTSLPEAIGGERNWDYRFSWIRDASFTLKAMFSLGHVAEADRYVHWLKQTFLSKGSHSLQIMYTLMGDDTSAEVRLDYLKGYRGSKPVRIGNAAFKQNQWDIYGEVMDAAYRFSDFVGKIDEELWPFFRDIVNLAVRNWRKPDDGIWEVRNGPFHFVYSKVMCWVALDRGIKIARRYGFSAPLDTWEKVRIAIAQEVLQKGFDKDMQSFIQYYGSKQLDASLLLIPLVGFLPIDDVRIQGTIAACRKELTEDGFLLRYRSPDGLHSKEAPFVLCNFWLAECLALSGKTQEARSLIKKTLSAANHLGLFAEEYSPVTGELLGNFPQAFSHIGLINATTELFKQKLKSFQKKNPDTLKKRIKKLLPFKIVLNNGEPPSHAITLNDPAQVLKSGLHNLQGAFFDSRAGRIDYTALKESSNYTAYQDLSIALKSCKPFDLSSDEEKKAFWINVYNSLIIHGVIALGIEETVKEAFLFFERIGYHIGGIFFTPRDIEHGILRLNRSAPGAVAAPFGWLDRRRRLCLKNFDARIHFALVCASNSCPPIEHYDAAAIDEQLDVSARSFLSRGGMRFVPEDKKLMLSQIFKWYASDFGSSKVALIEYIAQFTDSTTATALKSEANDLTIVYIPYDWNLNRAL